MSNQKDLWIKYFPAIYFDKKEPFFPIKIGCTVFNSEGTSPSFDRRIEFYGLEVEYVIEYAIYWDFDIEHLYELEHVWVFIDKKGEVCECESSFHGNYLRSLLKDRSNIEDGTHVRIYSQPGKHGFLPRVEYFDLLPDTFLYSPAWENAGSGGLLVPGRFEGLFETDANRDRMVENYLKKFRFKPSMEFLKYMPEESLFVEWEELFQLIRGFIYKKLKEIESAEHEDSRC